MTCRYISIFNMKRFTNINILLAFSTVAKEGSVSRAAEILNLTQPAVSHQLKRLAEEAGVALFTRTSHGLELTDDGRSLIIKAERVLEAMADFHQSAHRRSGRVGGTLKVGTIIDPEFIRLGQVLHRLRIEYPDIKTELTHGVSGNIMSRLLRGQIDAGYYLSGPRINELMPESDGNRIHAATLARFSYKVIAPAGWKKRLEGADWKTLAALPWIGTPEISIHHRLLRSIFDAEGVVQNVVALVDQEASMLEMVRAGVGLSLCRDSIALHQQQSFGLAVSTTAKIPAELSFITLDREKNRPTISAMFDLLQSTWGNS